MTLATAMRHQRDELAAALCAGLAVGAIGEEVGPALERSAGTVSRVSLGEIGGADVVVCLDGTAMQGAGALDALAALARSGTRVILGLRPPQPLIEDALKRLPDGIAIPQHAVEVACLGDGSPRTVRVPIPERAVDDALHVVIAAGFGVEAVAAATASVEAAGGALHFAHLLALEAANGELRRANARLASERLGVQGSAAASLVVGLEARIAAAQEQASAAERIAAGWQAEARQNDAYLQAARQHLQTPRHRAAEALHDRFDRLPGATALRSTRRKVGRLVGIPPAQHEPQPPPPQPPPPEPSPPATAAADAAAPPPSAAPENMHGTFVGDGRVLVRTTWGGRIFASARDLSLTPELLAHGTYDEPFTRFVQAELRAGDVAVDVGANIGLFTLLMARIVGPTGRVVAYEPEPENLALLRDNVAANYVADWVEIVAAAAAAQAGRATFYATERFKGNGSLVEHDADYFASFDIDSNVAIEVETEALDRRFDGFDGHIDLLKIDVEGAEHQVLRGACGLLEAGTVQRLCLEVIRARMAADWEPFVALLDELRADGWTFARLDADGRRVALSLPALVQRGHFSQVLLEPPAR